MCRNLKTLSICPSCSTQVSETSNKQWCRDARKRKTFGRCATGVRKAEEEFRGEECRPCAEARERALDRLTMEEIARKRLGWGRSGDGDGDDEDEDDGGYGW